METKRVFQRLGWGLAVYMGLYLLVGNGSYMLVAALRPAWMERDWTMWVCNSLPNYLIGAPIFYLIVKKIPDTRMDTTRKGTLRRKQWVALLLICMGITGVLSMATNLLKMLLDAMMGKSSAMNNVLQMLMDGNPLYYMLFAVLVGPVVEELVFRGLLYRKLAVYGGKTYVLYSALAFALFHGNLNQMSYAFFVGIVFATVYYYSHDIRIVMLLHVLVNFFGSGVTVLLSSYASEVVLALWSLVFLASVTVGAVMAVRWWKKHKSDFYFAPGERSVPFSETISNVGMVLFFCISGFMTLLQLFVL